MYRTFISLAIFAGSAFRIVAGDLTVYTPGLLKQCQDVNVTWTNGQGPYNLIVVHADDPCGDPIVDLGNFDCTSTTWKVTVAASTTIELSIADDDGDEAWSGAVTVAQSDDDSCLPGKAPISSSQSGHLPTATLQSTNSLSPINDNASPTNSVAPSPLSGVKNADLYNDATSSRQPYNPTLIFGAAVVAVVVFASH